MRMRLLMAFYYAYQGNSKSTALVSQAAPDTAATDAAVLA
jgi:hypothetical protein